MSDQSAFEVDVRCHLCGKVHRCRVERRIVATRNSSFATRAFSLLGIPREAPAPLSQSGDLIEVMGICPATGQRFGARIRHDDIVRHGLDPSFVSIRPIATFSEAENL